MSGQYTAYKCIIPSSFQITFLIVQISDRICSLFRVKLLQIIHIDRAEDQLKAWCVIFVRAESTLREFGLNECSKGRGENQKNSDKKMDTAIRERR